MTIFKKISYVITFFFITSSFSLANSEKKQEVNTLPLNEIRIFTEIFSKIKSGKIGICLKIFKKTFQKLTKTTIV